MKKERRSFTAEQKVSILREHLLEGNAVSRVCEAHGIAVSQFYTWQKQLFEGGAQAFLRERSENARERKLEEENARLRARLLRKDEVIAEVTADYVQLKKELGES